MWWLSYVGYRYDMQCISHLLGSDVSPNLWKDLEDPGGACLSPSYTSDKQFSKLRLLPKIGSPWSMTRRWQSVLRQHHTHHRCPTARRMRRTEEGKWRCLIDGHPCVRMPLLTTMNNEDGNGKSDSGDDNVDRGSDGDGDDKDKVGHTQKTIN
jgi:hypothetical protein